MLRILAFLLLLPPALLAQDAPRTILVLDGSGSMWGQIDGVNKIVIAREVMADLLATLPPEQELGLMSYGHRRKGDCSDIELMIPPGTDRMAIAKAVRGIKPKGKTPLSAAVIAAAEALRYTEEAATVILVSDGIETCDMDPCAVGENLEQTGVGFTAHVIGFDVGADPVAQAQLRCLAEATGGLYRDAANADELAGALEEVVVAEPEPEPMPVSTVVTFRAIDGPGGTEISDGLIWNIGTEDTGEIIVNDDDPTQLLDIFPGTGLAEVLRTTDAATAEASFTVAEGAGPMTVTLVLPEFLPAATVSGPAEAPAGSRISVEWTGPDLIHDKIVVVAVGATDEPHQDYAFTSDGTPATLRLATTPGSYELRYLMNAGNKVLATQPIEVTEVEARLDAPDSAAAGAELAIGWTGPDTDRDYIAIVPTGEDYRARLTYAYTGNGNPARITVPTQPGAYDLLYVLNANGTRALARRAITLTEVGATIEAPATAPVGSEISVGFTGPDTSKDSLILTTPDAPLTQPEELDIARPDRGSPARMTLPVVPGTYELRYMLGGRHGEIIARALIEATPATASIDGPATAFAHQEIAVSFTGPAQGYDIITIAPAGSDSDDYVDSEKASAGSPARLTVPLEPGAYVLRYQLGGRHGAILAEQPLSVTLPKASLTPHVGPVLAGDEIEVGFTGPGFRNDIVALTPAGGDRDDYVDSDKASAGSPARLTVPLEPGAYVLRYQLGGRHGASLAEQPLSVVQP